MSFAVLTQQTSGFDTIILEDKIALTKAVILPDYGAMLHSFIIKTGTGHFNIIDGYSNLQVLENEIADSFKSCKLSPFACRIPAGVYTFNNHDYKLQTNRSDGSSIHGLLFNKRFKLMDQIYDDNQASVRLRYDYEKTDNGYPFVYSCEILYTLQTGNMLQVQTTILNRGHQSIPLVDGWHPYFTLGGMIDEWMLQFNASSMLEFDENLVPTGREIPFTKFLEKQSLKGIDLDNSFVLDKDFKSAACTLLNPTNLQIYTPPGRKSIAIENLSGAPNCFNNKIGLIVLPAGESKTFTVRYKTNKE
jgi:aldose 1-epimerase